MKHCIVSIVDPEGQTQTIEVEASSMFDAADRALQQWCRLWWYRPGAVVEVRMGDQC